MGSKIYRRHVWQGNVRLRCMVWGLWDQSGKKYDLSRVFCGCLQQRPRRTGTFSGRAERCAGLLHGEGNAGAFEKSKVRVSDDYSRGSGGCSSEEMEWYLKPGDVILDGGNSYYRDTRRRYEWCRQRKICYVGVASPAESRGLCTAPA